MGWDSDRQLVILKRQDVAAILERYLANELSAADVEDWANALENREDLGYEQGSKDLLSLVIEELANPLLTRPLSKGISFAWLEQLTQATAST